MALWVRGLAAKPDNQSSIPELTSGRTTKFRTVPWHPSVCHGMLVYMYTHAHT